MYIYCIFLYMLLIRDAVFGQQKAKKYCNELAVVKPRFHGIIGGTLTYQNEFAHMAAVGYGESNNPEWLCGGTLISKQFVLTAAHCAQTIRGKPVKVRLGTRSLDSNGNQHVDMDVKQVIVHKSFKPPSQYYDVALLKLSKEVQTSRSIFPACLHAKAAISSADRLTAIGWGNTEFSGSRSNDLLKVNLKTYTRNECNKHYQNLPKEKLKKGIDNKIQICAGGTADEEKDTCQGDSGGPLEYRIGGVHYVVGITSFGKACGIARVPGVYTRVSAFVPWIESVVWR